jgi:hypothetical protein
MVSYTAIIPQRRNYYERFSMFATQGWKDLIEDVKPMLEAYNRIDTAESFEEFHKRKGQVDILLWLLSLQETSEQTYEELANETSV